MGSSIVENKLVALSLKDNLTFVVCGLIHWESQFALQFPFRKISSSYRPRSSPFYLFIKQCEVMKKTEKERRDSVIEMLKRQEIRDVSDIEAYKLSVCHGASAGIDLGSNSNYVAINPEIAAEMGIPIVREFSTLTSGHRACRDYLLSCGIKYVSMESTSVYWMNLYYTLTDAGIEVCLVNPKKFRMVPGRKTDILDCQWLQTLHMYGLLKGSLIPNEDIRKLRAYMRQRESLLQDRARYVQRMQKAMVQMNLMLVNVVDDITSNTGMAIIEDILKGERNPEVLAAHRDRRCKSSVAEIAESLNGCYKADQLDLLKLNYDAYNFFTGQIAEVDIRIGEILPMFPARKSANGDNGTRPSADKTKRRKKHEGKNVIKAGIDIGNALVGIVGVDLTSITGLGANTILQIISEVGTDMSKFPSAKHFAAYLGFVPRNKITGGVIISSKTDRTKSRAAQAFKKIIPSISRGDSAFAGFYHRVAARAGTGKAIVATCRKVSMAFYNTIVYGQEYVEEGNKKYKQRLEDREKALLERLARKHNVTLLPASA